MSFVVTPDSPLGTTRSDRPAAPGPPVRGSRWRFAALSLKGRVQAERSEHRLVVADDVVPPKAIQQLQR